MVQVWYLPARHKYVMNLSEHSKVNVGTGMCVCVNVWVCVCCVLSVKTGLAAETSRQIAVVCQQTCKSSAAGTDEVSARTAGTTQFTHFSSTLTLAKCC